jgi:ribosomal-protein-serine acetyltransferase
MTMVVCQVDNEIVLRLLESRHAEEGFALVEANRGYLREWFGWVDSVRTVEDTRDNITKALLRLADGNGFEMGIWYQGRMVGRLGLHLIDWTNRRTSMGYWLAQACQGKGIMTRSCRALVDYVFSDLRLNRMEISCAVGNRKSRAIPERLGFVDEGVTRDAEWLGDRFVDQVTYGMLAGDWPARVLEST